MAHGIVAALETSQDSSTNHGRLGGRLVKDGLNAKWHKEPVEPCTQIRRRQNEMTIVSKHAVKFSNKEVGIVDVLDDLGRVDDVKLFVLEWQCNFKVRSMHFETQFPGCFEWKWRVIGPDQRQISNTTVQHLEKSAVSAASIEHRAARPEMRIEQSQMGFLPIEEICVGRSCAVPVSIVVDRLHAEPGGYRNASGGGPAVHEISV